MIATLPHLIKCNTLVWTYFQCSCKPPCTYSYFYLTDHTIKSFFATFDKEFQGVGRTVKMHILECHTVEWLSLHQAGCGLMGEQGAESIHAKFNSLKRTYSSIRNPLDKDKLKSIMREHYLNIAPSMSAAVPPVEKR